MIRSQSSSKYSFPILQGQSNTPLRNYKYTAKGEKLSMRVIKGSQDKESVIIPIQISETKCLFFLFYFNHPLWFEFSFYSGVILLNNNPFLRMLLWKMNENKSLWKCLEQFLTPNEFPRNFSFLPLEHYCQETK